MKRLQRPSAIIIAIVFVYLFVSACNRLDMQQADDAPAPTATISGFVAEIDGDFMSVISPDDRTNIVPVEKGCKVDDAYPSCAN